MGMNSAPNDEPVVKSGFNSPETEKLAKEGFDALLAFTKGEMDEKEAATIVAASIGEIMAAKDPVAMDYLDPNSQRNQKHLSSGALEILRTCWQD